MEANLFINSWKQNSAGGIDSVDVLYDGAIKTLLDADGNSEIIANLRQWFKLAPLYKTSDITSTSDTWRLTSGTLKQGGIARVRAFMKHVPKNMYVFQKNLATGAMATMASFKNQSANYGIQVACPSEREMFIVATTLDNTQVIGMWYVNNSATRTGAID